MSGRTPVGVEVVEFSCAAERGTEAGHHFVHDQQRALALCKLAQCVQIAGSGRNAAGVADDRLEDHGSDLAGVRVEGSFNGGNVVVGQRVGKVRDLVRHAC